VCRLFGMSSAPNRVRATFWLLEAPDSLSEQSHRDPDGTGLGWFGPDGTPHRHRAPIAAAADRRFAQEARHVESETFLAHVRFASTGALEERNTHPFRQHGRLFAHNGVIEDLDRLDAELGAARALVHGETDSERFFALITRHIEESGDVSTGIVRAASWAAGHLPLYSLNLVLTTPHELWALRYPGTHGLHVLERAPGGPHGERRLDHAGTAGRLRVRSPHLAGERAVVVASERMDDNPHWRALRPGELLHVAPDLTVTTTLALPEPPRHLLTTADLRPEAAASQAHA
jgi:predicted glutamine amidotransferase